MLDRGCLYPTGTPEALWMFLGFLAATDRLDPASQPLDRLRDALRCAGLGDDGRPRPAMRLTSVANAIAPIAAQRTAS